MFEGRDHDNRNFPFVCLREKFKEYGIELNTNDLNANKSVAFELHLDVAKRITSVPTYLFLWETPQVNPRNAYDNLSNRYRFVFSWNDALIDDKFFVKFYLPIANDLPVFYDIGWRNRNRLCCIIAGNKSVIKWDARELYSKRVETIRWFESHAPNDFNLYGTGWFGSQARPGKFGKLFLKVSPHLNRLCGRKPFPSYRGKVENKHDILTKYRFSICYENMSGLPGYITEKIFDCFISGCIPVYWGAPNICDYVPNECFIDRRQFPDHESLYRFLSSMSEPTYNEYQYEILKFMKSEKPVPFYAETFATSVANKVISDFKRAS